MIWAQIALGLLSFLTKLQTFLHDREIRNAVKAEARAEALTATLKHREVRDEEDRRAAAAPDDELDGVLERYTRRSK